MGKMVRLDETRSSSSNRSENRGSGVLARAREYNKIIDENRTRSRSGERKPAGESDASSPSRTNEAPIPKNNSSSRGMSTKERAMMSLDADVFASGRPISPIKNGSRNAQNQHAQQSSHSQSVRSNHVEGSSGNIKTTPSTNAKSPVNYQAVSKQLTAQSLSPEQHQRKSSALTNKPTVSHPAETPPQALPAVTPELLVDALSGHEDGLLAIAERLMEHYDEGYDSMGEAIIDAFADVQKLFQHVVEAAHMEGAAYEAGRREEEFEKLKKSGGLKEKEPVLTETTPNAGKVDGEPIENASPQSRHDEFIDEDVREILEHAVSEGRALKDSHKYAECYILYEEACQSASALLPVDSDHRGRLQLSLARAESMNPERACAMLKYVIDDVLRSGLDTNTKIVMPDPSKRGDCVLQRPTPLKTTLSNVETTSKHNPSNNIYEEGNLQRSEELLASLVEEMKEVLTAPMYANCHPLQDVASRFWVALTEAQRNNLKNEERLEQKLGNLKGEFLLAREEWEDKYNTLHAEYEAYKKRVERINESNRLQGVSKPSLSQSFYDEIDGLNDLTLHPVYSNAAQSQTREAASVVSLESLTYHAKSLFSCNQDDFRENGGPTANDKLRERMDSSMEKGVSHHVSQRNSFESGGLGSPQVRTFGNSRNR